jgi:hypothetical protein
MDLVNQTRSAAGVNVCDPQFLVPIWLRPIDNSADALAVRKTDGSTYQIRACSWPSEQLASLAASPLRTLLGVSVKPKSAGFFFSRLLLSYYMAIIAFSLLCASELTLSSSRTCYFFFFSLICSFVFSPFRSFQSDICSTECCVL